MEQSAKEVDAAWSSKEDAGAAQRFQASGALKHEVFVMVRSDSGDWSLRVLDEPAQQGPKSPRSDIFSLASAFPSRGRAPLHGYPRAHFGEPDPCGDPGSAEAPEGASARARPVRPRSGAPRHRVPSRAVHVSGGFRDGEGVHGGAPAAGKRFRSAGRRMQRMQPL